MTFGQIDQGVAAEVRASLARHRVGQSAVALAIGKKQPTVSRKLAGKAPFTIIELQQIADLLAVPTASFFPDDIAPSRATA